MADIGDVSQGVRNFLAAFGPLAGLARQQEQDRLAAERQAQNAALLRQQEERAQQAALLANIQAMLGAERGTTGMGARVGEALGGPNLFGLQEPTGPATGLGGGASPGSAFFGQDMALSGFGRRADLSRTTGARRRERGRAAAAGGQALRQRPGRPPGGAGAPGGVPRPPGATPGAPRAAGVGGLPTLEGLIADNSRIAQQMRGQGTVRRAALMDRFNMNSKMIDALGTMADIARGRGTKKEKGDVATALAKLKTFEADSKIRKQAADLGRAQAEHQHSQYNLSDPKRRRAFNEDVRRFTEEAYNWLKPGAAKPVKPRPEMIGLDRAKMQRIREVLKWPDEQTYDYFKEVIKTGKDPAKMFEFLMQTVEEPTPIEITTVGPGEIWKSWQNLESAIGGGIAAPFRGLGTTRGPAIPPSRGLGRR